jgi:hypothetical protein
MLYISCRVLGENKIPLDTPFLVYKRATGHTGHSRVRYINKPVLSYVNLFEKTGSPAPGESEATMLHTFS